jgi:hypothetical protein
MKTKRIRKYYYLKPNEIIREGDEVMMLSNKGKVLNTCKKNDGWYHKERNALWPSPVRRPIKQREAAA